MIGIIIVSYGNPGRTVRFVKEECAKVAAEHRAVVVDNGGAEVSTQTLKEALDDGSGTPGQYFPGRTVTMTSFDRPAAVADTLEQFNFASYAYNASGRKARATFPFIGIERHYLGDRYEMDVREWEVYETGSEPETQSETVQRLFLGGSAYDAPMVLVKVNDGA